MPNSQIKSLTVDGVTYDIVDKTSGYITADSPALTGTPTAPTPSSGASDTQIATVKYVQDSMASAGAGTVTSVGVTNATNGGLSVSGSPITGSGTISVGHSNVLASAQTTSGIYPIKIDKNGHISEYGNAVSIPTKTSDLTNDSGFITSQYIENKTDYEIPVSRVGEIEVGETVIGTDSTNFPTSKAVVDYVDERVVQEIDAIDVGVTEIKANGTSLSIVDGVVNIPAIGPNQSIGLMTDQLMQLIGNGLNSIPTSTSQLTNDSGFITSYTDEKLKTTSANSDTTYYPILGTNNTSSSSTKVIDNYALSYDRGSSDHRAYLRIGTSGGAEGRLSLYTTSTGSVTIAGGSASTHRTVTLPDKTGTLALTSDIPTVPTNISSFTNDSGYLTASDIASVMTYKGTKANYAALPSTGNTTGDVWHLTSTGAEWAWDGSAWQELGTAIDTSSFLTSESDPVFTASPAHGIAASDITNWNGKTAVSIVRW